MISNLMKRTWLAITSSGSLKLYQNGEEREMELSAVPPEVIYQKLYDTIVNGAEPAIDPADIAKVIAVLEAAEKSSDGNQVIVL